MIFLTVDTMEEAREKLLGAVSGKPLKTERVPLSSACSRVLSEDITAPDALPAFCRSTVDGYAVRAADTFGAGESIPVFLTLAGEVEMGKPAGCSVSAGACAYVPTGGMLPDGADAMVMVEYCERLEGIGIAVSEAVSPGCNVILPGEDARAGAVLLKKGTRLRPLEIGVLAAAGILTPAVYAPLTMAILSTGDELTTPGEVPAPGRIRDINTHLVSALALKAGYEITQTRVLPDEEPLLIAAVKAAMQTSDLVVLSGGSSQGSKDMTVNIIGAASSRGILTHGLALKPGKPAITGYDDDSGTLLVGLPGHPVSAMMVFELLLGWLIDTLTAPRASTCVEAVIDRNVPGAPGKDTLQMVTLTESDGRYLASPLFLKSGLVSRTAAAAGYVLIGRNREGLRAGEPVRVFLF